jgi:hypothetical protein
MVSSMLFNKSIGGSVGSGSISTTSVKLGGGKNDGRVSTAGNPPSMPKAKVPACAPKDEAGAITKAVKPPKAGKSGG